MAGFNAITFPITGKDEERGQFKFFAIVAVKDFPPRAILTLWRFQTTPELVASGVAAPSGEPVPDGTTSIAFHHQKRREKKKSIVCAGILMLQERRREKKK